MVRSIISYLWRDRNAQQGFRSGVSLHSHTNQSHETLDFLTNFGKQFPVLRPLLFRMERKAETNYGIHINYAASYWTPPMTPKLAFDLERGQIEKLGLAAMVVLTDHDNIRAPLQLRVAPSAIQVPISVEWSVPYGEQFFHIGVHNLPSAKAAEWMETLKEYTAHRGDAQLSEILTELNRDSDVLIVFNHPMWDLCLIGKEKHDFLVNEFLQRNGAFLHALELNGLRNWQENRAAQRLAEKWNMPLVSGGDRHGVEASANINLTNATCFTEFVHEIRREKKSHVLFMPQYALPWKYRMLQAGVDVVQHFPEFPLGSRTWDDRFYHPDAHGVPTPLSQLWPEGKAPFALGLAARTLRMLGKAPIASGLRIACGVLTESRELRFALGEHNG